VALTNERQVAVQIRDLRIYSPHFKLQVVKQRESECRPPLFPFGAMTRAEIERYSLPRGKYRARAPP
jgi:hypothetical protein